MVGYTIDIEVAAPASVAFARLLDWDAHSTAIPLTRLHHEGRPRVGQRFVARTSIGVFGFDDPMRVDVLQEPAGDQPGDAPGVVEVTKTGTVIAGRVCWTVSPTWNGSQVQWRQTLLVPVPAWLDPLVARIGRSAYTRGLRRILR